ncbi:fumarylacetoacetase [Gymnodinialimonas hymeniacidonis]|uniref:fumarylacetoacetase n=1 Tax=Gymnodinialimonas hymeniacidonis TaxID=3126508 RepID=UPI0034C5E3F3
MSELKRSWLESANVPDTDFPLNNLPYGVFSVDDGDMRCGVALGDRIIDATGLEAAGHLRADADADVLDAPYWNDFMELGPAAWSAYRVALTAMLAEDASDGVQDIITTYSVPMAAATLHMPFRVAEYTDFYAGRHHATNVGTMFRGAENALPPNWLHIPIGYNGRASSVVVSGTDVHRPWGQLKAPDSEAPVFAPSKRFDIELEMGAIVGQPSDRPLTVDEACEHIFGYVLLNDWSARDIQAWEYQPLGPFQAKATATTISPWIVTAEALAPFRTATPAREKPLLPHLADTTPMNHDIALSVSLNDETIAETNANELYYSAAQQLAHHTTSGCPMRAGDLLGSGTISGPEKHQRGSLLELSWGGKEPIETDSGPRSFIEDGDTLALHGSAHGNGYRIGFGHCVGTVLAAAEDPFAH